MKNKKYLFINIGMIIISIVLALFISFRIYEVKADSGFDSSWDSGGSDSWDSGSSWDSSSSYGGGGSSSFDPFSAFILSTFLTIFYWAILLTNNGGVNVKTPKVIFISRLLILLLLIPFYPNIALLDFLGVFVVAFISSGKYNNINSSSNSNINYSSLSNEFILKQLSNLDVNNFYKEAFDIYKDIQIAWMDNDIERVRNILSDSMFNTYKMQLETLKVKNQKNMMEDITLKDVYITNINKSNDKEVIDVIMDVTCRDYLIDINTNKVLRGNKNKVWTYEYKLSYMRTNSNKEIDYCPNCGAKLNSGSSVKCEYCNAIINKDTSNFILIDKKMLSQR